MDNNENLLWTFSIYFPSGMILSQCVSSVTYADHFDKFHKWEAYPRKNESGWYVPAYILHVCVGIDAEFLRQVDEAKTLLAEMATAVESMNENVEIARGVALAAGYAEHVDAADLRNEKDRLEAEVDRMRSALHAILRAASPVPVQLEKEYIAQSADRILPQIARTALRALNPPNRPTAAPKTP